MSEKRREERKKVRVWIANNSMSEYKVWFPGEEKDENFTFLYPTVDLNKTGVFLESTYPISVGTVIEINFAISTDTHFTIKGEIVRVVDPEDAQKENIKAGMGVKFINLTTEQLNNLEKFMKKYGLS